MPKQDVAVELFYDGVWNDLVLNDDVLSEQIISITRGDADEGAATRPSMITLRLNNDADIYRTTNPLSVLYGKVGVNTPLRISVADIVRGIGEVTSWRCGQSRDFRANPKRGKAWTDVEANGVFWRINQWSQLIESTMSRGMRSFTTALAGAWPLEDTSDSTVLSNVANNGILGSFTGEVTLGNTSRPLGSSSSLSVATDGIATGNFIPSSNSGWQISFACRLFTTPSSGTYEELFSWYDSVGRRWTWEMNNTNYLWNIYNPDGTLITALSAGYGARTPADFWTRFRMKVSVSAGTITYEPAWYRQSETVTVGTSGTFAATSTGCLTKWVIKGFTYNNGGFYTGVFGLNNATSVILNANVLADFNGHDGEKTGARFTRLMTDLGFSSSVNGTAATAISMGEQPVASLSELLRELRDTEDGILFDGRTALSPIFNLRSFRFNQTAVVLDAKDNISTGLPTLPDEVNDDLGIANIITIENVNGGSLTIEDSTSSMGTQPPPDGKSEYRKTVKVSLYQPEINITPQAYWWLNRGTVDLPRYPQITVKLNTLSASRIVEIESLTIGDVIEIINYREYTIRVFIVGYTETIGTHSRSITFICRPDQQFVTGVWDGSSSYWDSATHFLKNGMLKTDTTCTFRSLSSKVVWSTSTPYDVMISGERATVTSMGAASLVSGGYDQVGILTRGVNGIIKLLPANSSVHAVPVGRWI